MLTSDIESKLAIVKSNPTYNGSPKIGNDMIYETFVNVKQCL